MIYKYETHLHTFEGSACAVSSGEQMAQLYSRKGYAGIFVTDHFFNGNSCISRDLDWAERVKQFCFGYEHAKAAGDRLGLDVFFGFEWNYHAMEFLVYGLNKDFLLANPNFDKLKPAKFARIVHDAGGFISQAHPFREAPYIREQVQYPELSDAAEVINMGNHSADMNRKALEYAEKHFLAKTAGSDIHSVDSFKGGGMAFDHRLTGPRDFMDCVRSGNCELLGDFI